MSDKVEINENLKYALVNKEIEEIVHIGNGQYVRAKHIRNAEDFLWAAENKRDVYYNKFLSHVRTKGYDYVMRLGYYKKSKNFPYYIERLQKEHPELMI